MRNGILFLVTALVGWSPNLTTAQQQPVLNAPTRNAQGGWSVLLRGQPGTNYTLEISHSLKSWLPLSSGLATLAGFEFHYSPDTNNGAVFFRARTDSVLPALRVGVQVDTNLQSITVVTPNEGGSMSVIDGHGVSYSLIVPPNAVLASQIVTMTVLTQLDGLPFATGSLGAVLLAADDPQLSQAAQLVIEFPKWAPVQTRQVAGYAFDGDGGYLRLTPSLPGTNSVTLPITIFSGLGCSIATAAEVTQQAQRSVAQPTNSVALQGLVHTEGPFYDSCYPAEKTRATFAGKGIENAMRKTSQTVAEKMFNSPPDATIGDLNLDQDFNSFTKDVLDTYGEEMKSNCSLAEKVFGALISVDRQAELTGVSADTSWQSGWCDLLSTCAKKIDDCCKNKGASVQGVYELEGIARQFELLGCAATDPYTYVMDCVPDWYGRVTLLDSYSFLKGFDGGEADQEYTLFVDLQSDTLVGQPNGTYMGVTGGLIGHVEGRFRDHSHQDLNCDGYVDTIFVTAIQKPVHVTWQLVWALTNTPPLPFPIPINGFLMNPNYNDAAALANVKGPVVETDAEPALNAAGDCEPDVKVRISNRSMAFNLVSVNYNSADIKGTATEVSGSYKTNWTTSDGTAYSRQVTWNLHKKP